MLKKQNHSYLFLISLITLFSSFANAININGAGASFPAPAYAQWADAYYKETGHQINYQSIGSGAGIKQIQAKTIDFGATDIPLSNDILEKNDLIQFPTLIGGVVPVINLAMLRPGELILNGQLLGDIFLGKIKKWNDPAIQAINPKIKLPEQPIQVIHRSDASGTSFLFTHYLSQVHKEWQEKIGFGATVNWPTGAGGKGNEGISALIQRLPGSISYVEYAYIKPSKMLYAKMYNNAKQIVAPGNDTFRAATQSIDWGKSSYQILTNTSHQEAWPITGATFILMQKTANKPENSRETLQFFDWSYHHGTNMASELGYVPLPEDLYEQIRTIWKQVRNHLGKVLYPN